jgi:Domain of unknown function (DUF222)
VQDVAEDNVLSDAELADLFGDSQDYEVLSDADRDLFAAACADLDFAGQYAHDPDNDPPLDTFWGRWERGERELELVDACEQRIAELHAMQCRALVRFAGLRPDENGRGTSKYVAEEIGLAAKWTARWAGSRLALAYALTGRLPGTLQALERGDVDLRRAQALADITRACPPEVARAVEDAVLPGAAGQNISELSRIARKQVAQLDPEGAAARHRERKKERRVEKYPLDDGMAELSATLTAPEAEQIYQTLDVFAQACKSEGDTRTADERRADALCDLLLDPRHHTTNGRTGGVQVQVTVPASTLMGVDDQPGDLAGYGPIPADLARDLAAEGTWRRLVTDPLSGTLLDYGRTTYRPPAGLADFVRARDQRCVFPACARAAKYCDIDHNDCYPHGTTSACNLACLCKRHHKLKHESEWQLIRDGDRFIWIAPTGLQYVRNPEPLATPRQSGPLTTPCPSQPAAPEPEPDEPPPF